MSWRQLSPERRGKLVSVHVVDFQNVNEEMLLELNFFFFLFFFAVSEQDSETMETSQQEPRTPNEESSPVTRTILLKINNINAPVRLCSLEEPSAVCSSKQAKCDQNGRFRHISVIPRT